MKSLHERLGSFSWPWQTPRLKRDAAFELEAQEATIRRMAREIAGLERLLAQLRDKNQRLEQEMLRIAGSGLAGCPVKSWTQVKREKESAMAKKAPAPPPMPAGKGKGKKGC